MDQDYNAIPGLAEAFVDSSPIAGFFWSGWIQAYNL